jgi:hypothetical protein
MTERLRAEKRAERAEADFRAVAEAVGAMHEPSMGPSHPGTREEVVEVAWQTRHAVNDLRAEVARLAAAMPTEEECAVLSIALRRYIEDCQVKGTNCPSCRDAKSRLSRLPAPVATKGGE